MFVLRVSGLFSWRHNNPEAELADMLRYDDGEMVEWKDLGPLSPELRGPRRFEAEVHTNTYTPERWRSFGLKTELIEKRPGKASCSFPDTESVMRAIHATKRHE